MSLLRTDWALYRSFLAVAQSGTLSGAARSLGLTQPTVGRHIEALEVSLGAPLFTRSQAGLRPTMLALDLIPHAETMAAAVASLARAASGERDGAHGVVRLTASDVFGTEMLPPMLASFASSHPGVTLELVVSNHNQDILRGDVDLAVRNVPPAQEALLARRIGTMPVRLFARREYLAAHGTPTTVEELPTHRLIGWDADTSGERGRRIARFGLGRDSFSFRCDSDVARLAALRCGLGIGACQVALAARDPALLPVLPELELGRLEIWLLMHEDLRASRRVRLLFEHLATTLLAYVAEAGESG